MPEREHNTEAKRTVAVFDLDRTLTTFDTYLPFLGFVCTYYPSRMLKLPALTAYLVAYGLRMRDNSWLKERFWSAIVGGLPCSRIDELGGKFAEFVCRRGMRKGAITVIDDHLAAEHDLVLASASLDVYVQHIAERLRFDTVVCTRAERADNAHFTGRLGSPNCYGKEKVRRLADVIDGPVEARRVIAYSDHHSDAGLLAWADRGVAVCPTRKMRVIAEQSSYRIVTDW